MLNTNVHTNVTQCYTQKLYKDYNVFKWVKNSWVGRKSQANKQRLHKNYTNVILMLQTC